MSWSNEGGWGVKQDVSHSQDSDSISGGGGGVMDVWDSDRVTKLNQLATATFTNNSSFKVPNGWVDSAGWQQGFSGQERRHGISAEGTPLDVDGTPLSGSAQIEQNGEDVAQADVSDVFALAASPPSGVISGGDEGLGAYDFRFTPVKAGADVLTQGIPVRYDAGVFQYGSIEGQVTDANGDPVSGESVSAPGAGTNTDTDGNYSFLAPGGTSVTLTSLRGEVDKDQTPNGGDTLTVDWQFAGLNVDVFIPDGSGIPGVRVTTELAEGDQQTGSSGIATFAEVAPNTTVTVGLFGSEEEREQSIGNEGTFSDLTEETGFGFKGNVTDADDGEGILGVDAAVDDGRVLTATTPEAGEYVIGGYNTGIVTLILGDEDRRYARFDKEFTVADGDVTRENVELQQQQNLSTY